MPQSNKHVQRLEPVLIMFFALVSISLVVVYLIEPSIYTTTFSLGSVTKERYPLPATLALLALLVFIAALIVGILRHWRWLFWLLLIAFASSLLEIPAILLQLAGVIQTFPKGFPLWYSLYRMGIALLEGGIAVWMIYIYRRYGVWGRGSI